MAPSRLGTILRSFTFEHVRQLDRAFEMILGPDLPRDRIDSLPELTGGKARGAKKKDNRLVPEAVSGTDHATHREIVGRDEELATLRAFLHGLPSGPGTLVLKGEPGVGKTTMWRAGVETAKEMSIRVLEASPAEAEARMSFAALDDLLAGAVEDTLPALPPPQRHALEVALLLTETGETPPDERAVAAAFLSALRLLSAPSPTLIAIDDIQWLDTPSASVVGYALRRLRDEPVAMLLALRTDEASAPPAELARVLEGNNASSLPLGPLTLGALHRLLRDRLELVLARPALRRVHEISGGNAFYALEIARALQRDGLQEPQGHPLRLPGSLGEIIRARIAALPAKTQRAVLFVACLAEPRLDIVSAALDADVRPALDPAIQGHVVELEGDRIRFTHPLLAASVYSSAAELERRDAHRRLAAAVDDPEEQARHLALSAEEPDEEVAAALEHAATHARARGAGGAAAELSEQAARLTPPEFERDAHRRLIETAGYRLGAGDTGRARELLEDVLPSLHPGEVRAETLVLLQRIHRYEGDQPRAAALAREALAEPGASEHIRAAASQGLASTLFFMREDLQAALDHARGAAKWSEFGLPLEPRWQALNAKGVLEAVMGLPEAVATLRAAEELGADASPGLVINLPTFTQGLVRLWFDDVAQAALVMHECHEEALASGDDGSIPLILVNLAAAEYLAGRWAQAEQAADGGYEAAIQTGQRPQQAYSLSVRALVRASLGREHEARADAAAALALAGERGMMAARIHCASALGLLELSLDRPDEVVGLIAPLREQLLAAGVGEPGSIRFVSDEVEALIVLGRLYEAEPLVGWLEERGRTLDRASALGAAARCRGLLAAAAGDLASAMIELEQSLVQYQRVQIPFEYARTLLALGSTQRRAKQKSAARTTLTNALAGFEELGAAIWADKARKVLVRIGGRAPSGDKLTPTEERVAELVAEGCSNKEVAAALFVSVRTVEGHLAKIYGKLGVRSRTALARRLLQ